MVPKVGFEPTRTKVHGALNAARLPVPPLRPSGQFYGTEQLWPGRVLEGLVHLTKYLAPQYELPLHW